jgi:hypothetical protein
MENAWEAPKAYRARRVYRAWINQPSNLQLLHALHGQRCIVEDTEGETVRLWFTEGKTHSMQAPRLCVSEFKLSAAQN